MAESSSSPSSAPAPIAEIDHGPSKLDQFLDAHTKKLVIGVVLIALSVIAYVVYDGLAEAEAQEAGAALLTAEKASDYQDIIKQWPESNAAASAMPLLADLQWEDSQPESIETLENFISQHPEHPSIATAKVSLGLRLLEQGKTADAVASLTEVAESDSETYIAPLACIALGDIAKAAGKTDDAKKWYEKAQEDPSEQGNTFKDTAAARLTLVNAKPPVKIKPALPIPPAPPSTPVPAPPATTQPDTPAGNQEKTTPADTTTAPPAAEAPKTPKTQTP
jgi:TolA-binding protein